jgi:hypothetical protein
MITFHGGCHGCTQQEGHGTDFCFDCCYFGPDWDKPSLNNRPPSPADLERQRVISRRTASLRLLPHPMTKTEYSELARDRARALAEETAILVNSARVDAMSASYDAILATLLAADRARIAENAKTTDDKLARALAMADEIIELLTPTP